MYHHNNFSSFNQHCGTGFASPQAINLNGTNNIGNVYFNLPPPPLPPFLGNQEASNLPSLTNPFVNKVEDYSNHLAPDIRSCKDAFDSNRQPSAFHGISKKKPSERKCIRLPFCELNVTSIKKDFMKCTGMMKEFERLLNLLQVFKRTLSNEDWCSRCEEIKSKEEEINKLLDKYENPEYFLAAQRVIKKCVKKRLYRKRKKKDWQEMKRISKAFREREHRRIDMWLEKMKEQAEKSKRQEQVKMEADLVLSEVTTKKAEAKRYINIFNTLTKLRNARVQQLVSSGTFVSESATKSFTEVINKLKKLWIDQLKEYNVEEQGLRVMLNDAEVERVNIKTKVDRQIQKKWNESFFGESTIKQSGFANNLDELIAIRNEWDRFVSVDKCLSSKIPIGWIVPSEPSTSDWSKFLQYKA